MPTIQTPECDVCKKALPNMEALNVHMARVHLETEHDRNQRVTKMISFALSPEESKHGGIAFYCTECGMEFRNIEDMKTNESVEHKDEDDTLERKSKVCIKEEVFSTGVKIIPDTDFITMNTADLKLMLEAIPEEVLNYEEDVFEKDFQIVLNSETIEAEVDHMESYRCNECNFRATSKRCLKAHVTFTHSSKFYNCKHCTVKTRTDPTMQYHLDMKHNTYWEDGQDVEIGKLVCQVKEENKKIYKTNRKFTQDNN